LIIHTRSVHKNSKVHKKPPEYTITKDNVALVVERVQDREVEEFEESQHQRDQIQYEMNDLRKVLEKIKEAQREERGTTSFPATLEEGDKAASNEHEMIHMIAQVSPTFHITPSMLRMDDIVGQTPLKYLV